MITKVGLYESRDGRYKKKWVVSWFGEYDPVTQKQKRYLKRFKLKSQAEIFQAQKTVEFSKGVQRDKISDVSLSKLCQDFIKSKPTLKPDTIKLYENAIRRLVDYFGAETPIRQITPHSAEMFIASLKPLNNIIQLSGSSIWRTLRNCRTIFSKARSWELINKNPFKQVTRPEIITRDWHYLKPEEYKRLLVAVNKAEDSLRLKALYGLAYTGGLRLGELLNLTWNNVNFETGEIKIKNRFATKDIPPFFVKDKDERAVILPKHTLDILIDLKAYYQLTDTESPFVLLDRDRYDRVVIKWQKYNQEKRSWQNRDIANNTLTNFKRHIRWAEIEPTGVLSIHTLRKSCIQNWADHINNPEVVRTLAGHADLKTTMQYYCQVNREQKTKAAETVDALLND